MVATSSELKRNIGQSAPSQIFGYQQKVGSGQYAATISRPDVCHAIAVLSKYLQNPSPEHIEAIDHLLHYLEATKYMALRLGPPIDESEYLRAYSDCSFVDDPNDRISSSGYAIQLFDGLIDWRSHKQSRVTTSTTEAEFYTVEVVARETYWWERLFKEVRLTLDEMPTIHCDNLQTVRLLTAEKPQLVTKLRHVDVANHWLRQGIHNNNFKIDWINTKSQIADGFTKALPPQRHKEFLAMIGMVDIKHLINTN